MTQLPALVMYTVMTTKGEYETEFDELTDTIEYAAMFTPKEYENSDKELAPDRRWVRLTITCEVLDP